jgi:predicted nucleic acid-binding protein
LLVLLDTNVVISAILFGGVPRQILEAAVVGEIDLITSPPLIAELEGVLTRKFGFTATVAASTRAELEGIGEVVEPASVEQVTKQVLYRLSYRPSETAVYLRKRTNRSPKQAGLFVGCVSQRSRSVSNPPIPEVPMSRQTS